MTGTRDDVSASRPPATWDRGPVGQPDRRLVRGWARSTGSHATVVTPEDGPAWRDLVGEAFPRGLIARGLGSGYGDCAQNAGGRVASTATLTGATVDEAAGIVVAGAGVPLADLAPLLAARGWTLPVIPGTTRVSLGGAIAADVHGKNHPSAGSLGSHVVWLDLLTPAHGEITVGPDRCPDYFWATVGGLGLTGVILRAAVRLTPAETAWMCCRDERLDDLDAALAGLRAAHRSGRFAAAWLDGCAGGDRIGRGVLSTCRPALLDDLPARRRRAARTYLRRRPLPIPPLPGPGMVNDRVVRAANAVHLRLSGRGREVPRPTGIALHPLDVTYGWPGLYGRRGLVQYQCAVPFGGEAVLREILAGAVEGGCPPSLAVLKQLGAADPAPLSFPFPGWTLALDFPAAAPGLAELLDAADVAVADAGGRVYLVKDGRLRPEMVPRMYPGLDRWRAVRATLDPDRRLCSDLSRRLRLTD